ncbi:MAG: ABC transporter permease [Lachnospiraceae bacterium]|nr:ABC transporter permease [Lachnospiraceae bacterium]
MAKYIAKRLVYMVMMVIVLSFVMYLIYNLIPNNRAYTDARAEIQTLKQGLTEEEKETRFDEIYLEYQRRYGTDTNNMLVRYLRWIGLYPKYDGSFDGLLQGNFGYSYEARDEVINVIKAPMFNTILINIFGTVFALGIAIPLGIVCAVKRGSKTDQVVQVITIVGYSLPVFLFCILFIWVFCSILGIFPPSGMKTPGSDYTGWKYVADTMYYLALPLITMTFCSLGGMTRYTRASMIEALSMDCIKTARAKGLREKVVIYSHAFRNALIPIVTLVVGWFLSIFSGSLIIESLFGLHGMGKLMIQSLRTADFDVVILMQLFYVAISLLGNLIIDIIYGLVDPRIRVSK